MKDMEEIAGLLHVHKEALAHGPAMSHIVAAAYERLREINEDLNPHKRSTHKQTAFDKEVPPRAVVPEPEPNETRIVDESGEPTETPVVERRDL